MVSRRRRMFTEFDGRAFLVALRHCRGACIETQRRAPFQSDIYRRTSALMAAIDDVAETLTGDREHFWLKPHGTPSK